VKVAVPVSGMSDLESYVTNKVINGHCDCMFAINTFQWEWTTMLALFAPKPLLFANSDNDPIFPMDGNRRIIARLRQCYEMHGAKDKVDEYVSVGGHDYRPDLRKAVFAFFHKYLKNDATAVTDAVFPKIEGKELRVFPTDADLPKDAINATADEVFVPKADVKLPTKDTFAAWKAGLVKQLRERCFRALPEKVPAAVRTKRDDWVQTEPGIEIEFSSLEGGVLRRPMVPGNTLFVIDIEGKKALKSDERRTRGFCVVSPRGYGERQWTRKNPPNTVERSLALLGQTADSGRVRDVIAVLVAQLPVKGPVIGRGQAGIIAAYAALLSPGLVDEVVILDPPTSHQSGPHFLNVLRVLDTPEALGLLAPDVKLTLVNAKDAAFDRTAAIYDAAGARDKFTRS
jgi:hypothetical protein